MSYSFERTKQKMKERVGSDNRIVRDYLLEYECKSAADPDPSVLDVKIGLGLSTGGGFLDDPNATLREIEVNRMATIPPWCRWSIGLVYSTEATVPSTDSQDPTQARVKRSKAYREISRFIIQDRNQKLITNAAGQPFPDGVPVTDYPSVFRYERYVVTPTVGFHKTINLNKFNNCPPKTLLCLIVQEEEYEGAWYFWKETIEMHFDPLGWPNPLVNAGLKQMCSDGKLRDCTDGNQAPLTQPAPLYDSTAFGQLPGSQIPDSALPAAACWLSVDYYKPMDFALMNLKEFPAT